MVGKDDVVSYILRGLRKWDVDSVTLGNSGVSEPPKYLRTPCRFQLIRIARPYKKLGSECLSAYKKDLSNSIASEGCL